MSTNTQVQPPAQVSRNARRAHHERNPGWLDVGPMRDWLSEYVLAADCDGIAVAGRLGIDPRALSRILNAETKSISLRLADEIFVSAGDPNELNVLYPLDDSALELDPEDKRWAIADERLFGAPADERWCRCCKARVTTDDRALCSRCTRSTLPMPEGVL